MVPLKAAWGVADFISSICAANTMIVCVEDAMIKSSFPLLSACLTPCYVCMLRSQGKQRLSGLKRRLCRALADGHTDPTEEGWAFIQNSLSQIHTAGLGHPATDITNGVQDKHHSKWSPEAIPLKKKTLSCDLKDTDCKEREFEMQQEQLEMCCEVTKTFNFVQQNTDQFILEL